MADVFLVALVGAPLFEFGVALSVGSGIGQILQDDRWTHISFMYEKGGIFVARLAAIMIAALFAAYAGGDGIDPAAVVASVICFILWIALSLWGAMRTYKLLKSPD